MRANIDDSFLGRFNAIIRFPEPGPEERAEIWQRAGKPRRNLSGPLPAIPQSQRAMASFGQKRPFTGASRNGRLRIRKRPFGLLHDTFGMEGQISIQ